MASHPINRNKYLVTIENIKTSLIATSTNDGTILVGYPIVSKEFDNGASILGTSGNVRTKLDKELLGTHTDARAQLGTRADARTNDLRIISYGGTSLL